MKTIFGPVPSRRLGRSLGIDVIPPKTCSYDCLYCESGRTTRLTTERMAFVSPSKVLEDLNDYFEHYPGAADVLTFSSAGEPTLYEPLGELIQLVKKQFPSLPLIVLTNGSLLWKPEVRHALLMADRVVPSVDAVSDAVFRRLNRPHPGLDNAVILEGLRAFRREYSGRLHIEVMLVSGLNDTDEELEKISRFVNSVEPDHVELNTVVRPPSEPETRGLSRERMEKCSRFFPSATTLIIGSFNGLCTGNEDPDLGRRVLTLVERRPCSIGEMAAALGVSKTEMDRAVLSLERENRLTRYLYNDIEYVCPPTRTPCPDDPSGDDRTV